MSYARARLANRVAPVLQDESLSETIEGGVKKGLMAAGFDEDSANSAAPWLSLIPELLPGVGGVVGADNTRKHMADGNYGMAALEGGLTVAGEALPVIGDLAKWAILAPALAKKTKVPEVRRSTEAERLQGPRSKTTGEYTTMPKGRREAMVGTSPGKTREALARAGDYETVMTDTYDINKLPTLTSKEMEGAAIIPLRGDPTAAGTLSQMSGVPIRPLKLQSGAHYPLASAAERGGKDNAAWESTWKIANPYQQKVVDVAEANKSDNIWGAYDMMDMGSSNFSTMPVEAALREMETLVEAGAKYPPKMVKQIDDHVRSVNKGKFKDFPGMNHPDAEAYLARPGYQDARKAITNKMSGEEFKDAGFPNIHQIYRDIAIPELHGNAMGTNGQMLVKLNPNAAIDDLSDHRSYGWRIPIARGHNVIGKFGRPIEHEELYTGAHRDMKGMLTDPDGKAAQREMSRMEKMNTTAWTKPGGDKTDGFQKVTDKTLQSLLDMGFLFD
jgi:hypothetical protein